jgi:hypothetical protein
MVLGWPPPHSLVDVARPELESIVLREFLGGGKDMPALSTKEAIERLAKGVEQARPPALAEVYAEIFPEKAGTATPSAADLARHVRSGLEPEEVVDLWNVVFPLDRNVWYDEQEDQIHYNEEVVGYAEAD